MVAVTSPQTLCLAQLSAEHIGALQPLLADPLVRGPANIPPPFDARHAESFLRTRIRLAAEGRAISFAALLDGRPCGGATLHGICRRASSAEIGFWLGRPFWGRGLGAEIVVLAIEAAVLDLGLTGIEARCREDNYAAHRLLIGLGFGRTGVEWVPPVGPTVIFRWRCDHAEAGADGAA